MKIFSNGTMFCLKRKNFSPKKITLIETGEKLNRNSGEGRFFPFSLRFFGQE